MLRDAGVRTKLLAVLALPTVLLLVVTAILVGGQAAQARRAGQVRVLADVAASVNAVVHGLQRERSATLRRLEQPGPVHQAEMQAARTATDTLVVGLDQLVDESSLDGATEAVRSSLARSAAAHAELTGARASIDAERFFATETDVFYAKVIRADLELPGRIAGSGTPELAADLQAFAALSSAIEYASHERDVVEIALLAGSLNEAEFAQTSALLAQQRQSLLDFQGSAAPPVFSRLDAKLAQADNYEIDQVRRALSDLLRGQRPDRAGATAWVGAADSRIRAMTATEAGLVADIGNAASATQLGQERRSLLLVGAAVLGLGLALMLAIGLARRITRPLRRLTAAAGEIGDELPRMVERMQTPGEGPGVAVEPIPVESSDEIGRLAEAFNTVNSVTVQVATEQAALRSSIAGMFVNVARRNQVLLGRQLKELDGMEASEEDPDVLQRLFTLDHLATRMRRNAESLLVLAGIDSTRRLRSALPLSDVIRTAVGEIESYDRIDLSMSEDCDVSGRHALTVAHLLAELLENATHFSNPETRVVVTAALTA
ncbi:MAG: nitrate- and nitrite sensing domain-containing protein, partial [Spirochaetaceae bacterium]|nr:nitrate- and nitrite sensing domain-containing protein [Spirochaetaceae bacterium]